MIKMSKRMKATSEFVNPEKAYSLEEAVENLAKFPKTKFDETVELHFSLNLDTKNTDQNVRGTVILPHGLGKSIRVAAFCKGEVQQKATDAGANYVGANDLIDKVAGGFMDFDVVVASPDMMRDLSKLGKILGPRGLMPTPKAGTVTQDIEKAIKEVKAGKIEFKSDKQLGIHVGIGKKSFPKEKIIENAQRLIEAVHSASPAAVKANLIKSLYITTTMGPSMRLAV